MLRLGSPLSPALGPWVRDCRRLSHSDPMSRLGEAEAWSRRRKSWKWKRPLWIVDLPTYVPGTLLSGQGFKQRRSLLIPNTAARVVTEEAAQQTFERSPR